MLKLCVAGVAGKMGNAIIREASAKGFQVVGAVEAANNPFVGKSVRGLGISDFDTQIVGPEGISEAVRDADIPTVANLGKRIILGTTGFTEEQNHAIRRAVRDKVPAVFSPNYSVGVNILFKVAQGLKAFPPEYDFSINEIHHTGKKDAPSGTAKKLGEIIAGIRGYSKTVYGREGISPRKPEELEIAALRAGGVPGIHDLIVAGPYEMLRIEHTAFSRNVFAQGAVFAAEWLSKQTEPRIFTMEDVLELS
jgi:4-hydroxy-tetrahydrodipicolinate reductase